MVYCLLFLALRGCSGERARSPVYGLSFIVLCAGDDFVLQLFCHIVEIVRIACYAHQQVAVVVRMFLSIEQCLGIHDIELYMVTSEFKVCAYEAGTFLHVLVLPEQLWREAYIEQCTSTLCLVEFAQRLYYRCRTV